MRTSISFPRRTRVRLFRTLAARAGLAIQNAVLFQEAQRRTTELEALSRGDQALHTSIELPNVLEAMLDMAGDLFGAERSLFLTFNEQGIFHAAASRGVPNEELEKLQLVFLEELLVVVLIQRFRLVKLVEPNAVFSHRSGDLLAV